MAKKAVLILGIALIILSFFGCGVQNFSQKDEETFVYGEFTSEEIYIRPEGDFTAYDEPDEYEPETIITATEETLSEDEKEQETTKIILENPPFEGGGIVLPDDEL